jgi:hypothetical protein
MPVCNLARADLFHAVVSAFMPAWSLSAHAVAVEIDQLAGIDVVNDVYDTTAAVEDQGERILAGDDVLTGRALVPKSVGYKFTLDPPVVIFQVKRIVASIVFQRT